MPWGLLITPVRSPRDSSPVAGCRTSRDQLTDRCAESLKDCNETGPSAK